MSLRSRALVLAAYAAFTVAVYAVIWNTDNPIKGTVNAFFVRSGLAEREDDCAKYAQAMVEQCVAWARQTVQYYLISIAMAIAVPITFVFTKAGLGRILASHNRI